MKNKMTYFAVLFLVAFIGTMKAQQLKKAPQSFEYVSALYDAVSNEVSIQMKDVNNVVKQFLYSPNDNTQVESILFNPIQSLQGNSNVLTKTELIGTIYLIEFNYVGSGQEGSTCCYKIVSCTPQ